MPCSSKTDFHFPASRFPHTRTQGIGNTPRQCKPEPSLIPSWLTCGSHLVPNVLVSFRLVLFHVRSAGGTLPILTAWEYRLLGRGSAASRRLSNSACAHCIKPCMTSEREARCSQTVKITKIKKIRASLNADTDCIRSGVENAAQAAFPAAVGSTTSLKG